MSDKPRLSHNYGTVDKEYGMFLATRPPEEDGPLYMVNLMKYHEVAQYSEDGVVDHAISGREADDRYNPASVLNKIGATIVFAGDVTSNNVGDEDWDRIAIVRYATRKSFIEMQSRKDFGDKHVHKAAGMLRTTLVCCRPQTPDRAGAFAALPGAINFSAEGTIIGDGRKWDTVQFVPVKSEAEVTELAASLDYCKPGESYVMGLQVVLDSITLP
ncbi:MAG: hypothetical protein EBY23_10745 [Actinobacteria bacterium]|nr:hypothetical protein [Actinomycetota bacterium]